jgi:hypothetical protein
VPVLCVSPLRASIWGKHPIAASIYYSLYYRLRECALDPTRSKMMKTQTETYLPGTTKNIGIAADHGGFELKEYLAGKLREAGYEVTDFGDRKLKSDDDYPDFVIPLSVRRFARELDSHHEAHSDQFVPTL